MNRDDLHKFILFESKNSIAVMGPPDTTEGACFSREEICRCTGWHRQDHATLICRLLNARFKTDKPKGGIASIIGKWPGDETDEEIAKALKDMS